MAQSMAAVELCSEKKTSLFLADFNNGKLVPEQAAGLKVAYYDYSGTEHRHKSDRTLVCETEQVQYVGHNTGVNALRNSTGCRYLVAAYSRRRGKVRLYDSDVFKLHPIFPADETKTEEKEDEKLTFRQKADELTTAFGTVRGRRALESRVKNTIHGESLEVAMNSVVTDVLARPDAHSIIANPVVSDIIPPYDQDATDPSGVYNINDIMDESVRDVMSGPAELFINSTKEDYKEWNDCQLYGSYLLNQLIMLPIEPTARREKAIHLMYLNYMITLFKMNASEVKRRNMFPNDVPPLVVKSLTDRFTKEGIVPGHKTSRCMPARMKDKLLAYICVLCLILDEFSLDFVSLVIDLKTGIQRIIQTLRLLGCQTKDQKIPGPDGHMITVGTATLKVPLTFPEQTARLRKPRR